MHYNNGFPDDFRGKMIPDKPRSNITDKRKIKLEDILKSSYIPFLGGRPNRDTIIGKEDLCDLKIAFALSSNSDMFLQ